MLEAVRVPTRRTVAGFVEVKAVRVGLPALFAARLRATPEPICEDGVHVGERADHERVPISASCSASFAHSAWTYASVR